VAYALNMGITGDPLARLAKSMPIAANLIELYVVIGKRLAWRSPRSSRTGLGMRRRPINIPANERPAIRNNLNRVLSELRMADESKNKKSAKAIHEDLRAN
jgi:hypothetical protein